MRIPRLLLTSAVVSVLLTGCASGARDDSQTSLPALTTPPTTRITSSATSTSARPVATTPPGNGAAISDVIRWIEAGTAASPDDYHSATRDGSTTQLGDDVAFVTSGGEANCVTNKYLDGALSCLVKLTNPPPRPPGVETAWKDNWVDFSGTSVEIGSPHGDPGPFVNGSGGELAAGQTLAFGDYRCRADPAGLFCVNYAHRSAVRLSAAGVEPFGCLKEATPSEGIGRQFSC